MIMSTYYAAQFFIARSALPANWFLIICSTWTLIPTYKLFTLDPSNFILYKCDLFVYEFYKCDAYKYKILAGGVPSLANCNPFRFCYLLFSD